MDKNREELIIEMIELTPSEDVQLSICRKNMEVGDFLNVKHKLMHWQKHIAKDRGEFYLPIFLPEKMTFGSVAYKRFAEFFKYCPQINDLFTLHKDKVTYNQNLTEEEQKEIREFVDANLYIKRRYRYRSSTDD